MVLRGGRRTLLSLPFGGGPLARVVSDATGKLVVFLHGAGETDAAWRSQGDDAAVDYGSRLADNLDFTPLYLRYDTKLRIGENGRRFAELLEKTVADWPVPVTEIALVGHAMGGHIVRAACDTATAEGHRWVGAVRHAVYLGSPHLGASAEKAASAAAWLRAVFPEARSLASLLHAHEGGNGSLRWAADDQRSVPAPRGASHYFVWATTARDSVTPVTDLLGDLLVLAGAPSERPHSVRRVVFGLGEDLRSAGAGHVRLLDRPEVYDQLRTWFGTTPPLEPAEDVPAPGAAEPGEPAEPRPPVRGRVRSFIVRPIDDPDWAAKKEKKAAKAAEAVPGRKSPGRVRSFIAKPVVRDDPGQVD